MVLAAGKKRAYCEIKSPVKTSDGQGGNTIGSYTSAGYEWFRAVQKSQSRSLDQDGIKYRKAVEFTGNKRSDLVITSENIIIWNSETYTIHSIIPSEKLDEQTIMAYV
jgi:hypothetical protein